MLYKLTQSLFKKVHCIDCGIEMDPGLSCYTFEGKAICTECNKNRYNKYIESLPPVKIFRTTCKACGTQISVTNNQKPFCFDCLCKFIYKVGKRNKEQMNIFE